MSASRWPKRRIASTSFIAEVNCFTSFVEVVRDSSGLLLSPPLTQRVDRIGSIPPFILGSPESAPCLSGSYCSPHNPCLGRENPSRIFHAILHFVPRLYPH